MDTTSEENHEPVKPRQVTYAFFLILTTLITGGLSYSINVILYWQELMSVSMV